MARTASNHSDILRTQSRSGGVHDPSPLGQQFAVPVSKESESVKKTCRLKEGGPNEQIVRRVTADMEKITAGGRGKSMKHLLLDRSPQNEQQLGAVFAPNSMTPSGSGKDTPLSEEKKAKERFLMFTRVLMKYLEQRDVAMHAKARLQIRECYEKRGMGDPQFQSLNFTTSLKAQLRSTVGELYWKKAHDYLDHFLQQKKRAKETGRQTAARVVKKGASAKVAASGTKKKLAKRASATNRKGRHSNITAAALQADLAWERGRAASLNAAVTLEKGKVAFLAAELEQEKRKVRKMALLLAEAVKTADANLAEVRGDLGREKEKTGALKAELARESEKATTLIGIEQERDTALASLATVTEEKKDLEEELTEANELAVQQLLFTDRWHGKFDELAALAASGQVDGAAIAEIRYR